MRQLFLGFGAFKAILLLLSWSSPVGAWLSSLIAFPKRQTGLRASMEPQHASPSSIGDDALPPKVPGCPFDIKSPEHINPSFGPGYIFYRLSELVKHEKLFYFTSSSSSTTEENPVLMATGYPAIREVLSQEFDTLTSQGVQFTAKVVGTNSLRFVTASKHDHAQVRALVGQALSQKVIYKSYIPSLQAIAESILQQALLTSQQKDDDDADYVTIDMEPICLQYTLHVAIRLILGLDESVVPTKAMPELASIVHNWIMGIFASDDSWKTDRAHLVRLIEEQMERIDQARATNGTTGSPSTALEHMMHATIQEDGQDEPRRLTRDEIIDNTLLLILAGTETSSGTLTIGSLLLGLHAPHVWNKLVAEQETIFAAKPNGNDDQRQLDRSDLELSTYLDGVIREALRLKPVVGGSMRGTTKTMNVGDFSIPKGFSVKYDRYLTHLLDPKTRTPNDSHMDLIDGFQPERWQSKETRPGNDFIPFGVGPRYCLGADLALAEMQAFMIVMVRTLGADNFKMVEPKPAQPVRYRPSSLVPLPEKGVWIRVNKSVVSAAAAQ